MRFLSDIAEQGLSRVLMLDPQSQQKIKQLEGKVLCFELTVPELVFHLIAEDGHIKFITQSSSQHDVQEDIKADVTLTGSALSFARFFAEKANTNTLANYQISISGDMETGQQLQNVFSQIDLDWEELVAQLTNDMVARKVGNFVRQTGDWAQESVALSRENIADYLKEELQILPTKEMTDNIKQKAETLRQDVDRLQQRLDKLRQGLVQSNQDTDDPQQDNLGRRR